MAKRPRRSALDEMLDELGPTQPTNHATHQPVPQRPKRQKMTVDLRDQASLSKAANIAADLGVSKSDVMEFALALLYQMWERGTIDFKPYKSEEPYKNQEWRSRQILLIPDEIKLKNQG